MGEGFEWVRSNFWPHAAWSQQGRGRSLFKTFFPPPPSPSASPTNKDATNLQSVGFGTRGPPNPPVVRTPFAARHHKQLGSSWSCPFVAVHCSR